MPRQVPVVSTIETVRTLVDRLARLEAIDRVAKPVAAKVSDVVGHGGLKDLLSGTWLGHPLHPVLTDLPIGFWTSSFVLDLVGGPSSRRASKRLLGLGILSALPTAAAGLSDWSDTLGKERRLGAAHAVGNGAALVLYGWSWRARRSGSWGKGAALGFLGAGAATVGGYLGGHLVSRSGVGVDRNAWKQRVTDWVDVGEQFDLNDGGHRVVEVGEDRVLMVRRGLDIEAISNVCGHAGGPLDEGTVDAAGCVTCPWHASVFRLADGHVVHGPATGHQPAYDVRAGNARLAVLRRPTA